jgi:hypothetical protein
MALESAAEAFAQEADNASSHARWKASRAAAALAVAGNTAFARPEAVLSRVMFVLSYPCVRSTSAFLTVRLQF